MCILWINIAFSLLIVWNKYTADVHRQLVSHMYIIKAGNEQQLLSSFFQKKKKIVHKLIIHEQI